MDDVRARSLAAQWRATAHKVAQDIKGKPGHWRGNKPKGIVKEKMGTQCSVLLTCAAQLEALL
jgi:hypothetical protein